MIDPLNENFTYVNPDLTFNLLFLAWMSTLVEKVNELEARIAALEP